MYYCQADGGQWNVPVQILSEISKDLCIIRGKDLISDIVVEGYGLKLAFRNTVFDTEQGEDFFTKP